MAVTAKRVTICDDDLVTLAEFVGFWWASEAPWLGPIEPGDDYDAFIHRKESAVRMLRSEHGGFPKPVGKRGRAQLFRLGDLRSWEPLRSIAVARARRATSSAQATSEPVKVDDQTTIGRELRRLLTPVGCASPGPVVGPAFRSGEHLKDELLENERLEKASPKWILDRAWRACARWMDPGTAEVQLRHLCVALTFVLHTLRNGQTAEATQQYGEITSPDGPVFEILERCAESIKTPSPELAQAVHLLSDVRDRKSLLEHPEDRDRLVAALDHLLTDRLTPGEMVEVVLRHLDAPTADQRESLVTPPGLTHLVIAAANPQPDELVLDPACAEGGFLLAAAQATRGAVTLVGAESDPYAWAVATIRLSLWGVPADITMGSFPEEGPGSSIKADLVLADPPIQSRKEYLTWLTLAADVMSDEGRAVIVLPSLTYDSDRREWKAVGKRFARAVIRTPGRRRSETNEGLAIWLLDQDPGDEILRIDASQLGDRKRGLTTVSAVEAKLVGQVIDRGIDGPPLAVRIPTEVIDRRSLGIAHHRTASRRGSADVSSQIPLVPADQGSDGRPDPIDALGAEITAVSDRLKNVSHRDWGAFSGADRRTMVDELLTSVTTALTQFDVHYLASLGIDPPLVIAGDRACDIVQALHVEATRRLGLVRSPAGVLSPGPGAHHLEDFDGVTQFMVRAVDERSQTKRIDWPVKEARQLVSECGVPFSDVSHLGFEFSTHETYMRLLPLSDVTYESTSSDSDVESAWSLTHRLIKTLSMSFDDAVGLISVMNDAQRVAARRLATLLFNRMLDGDWTYSDPIQLLLHWPDLIRSAVVTANHEGSLPPIGPSIVVEGVSNRLLVEASIDLLLRDEVPEDDSSSLDTGLGIDAWLLDSTHAGWRDEIDLGKALDALEQREERPTGLQIHAAHFVGPMKDWKASRLAAVRFLKDWIANSGKSESGLTDRVAECFDAVRTLAPGVPVAWPVIPGLKVPTGLPIQVWSWMFNWFERTAGESEVTHLLPVVKQG